MTAIAALQEPRSINSRILRAVASVFAAGAMVKIAAMGKEFVVAGVFGRSDAMDAFLAAFLIPNLLINLIAESMNQALVPTLIKVRMRDGWERAQELLSSSMLWLCGLLTAAAVLMALLARAFFPLIGSGFPALKLDLSVRLFYALLPVVLLSGIAATCTAVLNAFERFAMPALAALVMPVSIVAGALLLHGTVGNLGAGVGNPVGRRRACGPDGLDDGGSRLPVSPPLARQERSDPRGGTPVWAGAAELGRRIGRPAGGPGDGGDVACGERLRAGICQPVCERGGDADGGSGVVGDRALLLNMIADRDWQGCRRTRAPGHGSWPWFRFRLRDFSSLGRSRWYGSPSNTVHSVPGHGGGGFGAGDVCYSDSVFCRKPGVLSICGRHAAHRPGSLVRQS